jgi:glycosyltransferase involved in cell wall biosynthesis
MGKDPVTAFIAIANSTINPACKLMEKAVTDPTPWPRITIITPSFNQAPFLEETIQSVLLQNYPNLEYLIYDGGSTDGSVSIIEQYSDRITEWSSGPDGGQSQAINKGFARATGEWVSWLNSDDALMPDALFEIARASLSNPDAVLIYGEADLIRQDGSLIGKNYSKPYSKQIMLEEGNPVPQPSAFINRKAFYQVGGLDETLRFTMDYDLWFRLGEAGNIVYLEKPLSKMRVHPEAKTASGDQRFFVEVRKVAGRYGGQGLPLLHAEWLVMMHWRKATRAYIAGDWSAGQHELHYIMQNVPHWQQSNELSQRLLDRLLLMVQKGEQTEDAALELGAHIAQHLPPQTTQPATVRAQFLSLLNQATAFRYYQQGNWAGVLRCVWQAVAWDKRNLLNKGLWAISLKSAAKRLLPRTSTHEVKQ